LKRNHTIIRPCSSLVVSLRYVSFQVTTCSESSHNQRSVQRVLQPFTHAHALARPHSPIAERNTSSAQNAKNHVRTCTLPWCPSKFCFMAILPAAPLMRSAAGPRAISSSFRTCGVRVDESDNNPTSNPSPSLRGFHARTCLELPHRHVLLREGGALPSGVPCRRQ
jgi:hypothetical protein